MRKFLTYSAFRLGDNLAHLHFVRALAKANPEAHFQHAALMQYLPQMVEVVADLPNVSLRSIRHCNGEAGVNAWKNAGGFWEMHALKAKYAEFMLVWFDVLARRLGLSSPFKEPADLLFDYPALEHDKDAAGITLHPLPVNVEPFDFLVVNSVPMSAQWRGFDEVGLNDLIQGLVNAGHDVITTRKSGIDGAPPIAELLPGATVTDIGRISRLAQLGIIMVSTGPSWPTLNVWTRDKFRIVLQDTETLGLTTNTFQCATIAQAKTALRKNGFA